MRLACLHRCSLTQYKHRFLPRPSLVPCRQLEVLRNSEDGGERGSLLWLLDHTKTPMGGRLLRHWVAHPLRDAAAIQARLDAVEEILHAASPGAASHCSTARLDCRSRA